MYEILDHTADLGLRVRAPSREQLFADAAAGLMAIIADDPGRIRPARSETFEITGDDPALLLFDWLNELLYAFETRRMLFACFRVTFAATGLRAVAEGEPYDPARHRLGHEVKAITYHGLEASETAAGWEATVIVDI